MTPREAEREKGVGGDKVIIPTMIQLAAFYIAFSHTHSFQGRPEVPDVHFNLGSVTAEAQKWDEMWALLHVCG